MESEYIMNNKYIQEILEKTVKDNKNNEIVGLNKVKVVKQIEYDNEGNILLPAVITLEK